MSSSPLERVAESSLTKTGIWRRTHGTYRNTYFQGNMDSHQLSNMLRIAGSTQTILTEKTISRSLSLSHCAPQDINPFSRRMVLVRRQKEFEKSFLLSISSCGVIENATTKRFKTSRVQAKSVLSFYGWNLPLTLSRSRKREGSWKPASYWYTQLHHVQRGVYLLISCD